MPVLNLFDRIFLCVVLCFFTSAAAVAQSTHYSVKLASDFERPRLLGDETIEFQADAGDVVWEKQAGLQIVTANVADGEVMLPPIFNLPFPSVWRRNVS